MMVVSAEHRGATGGLLFLLLALAACSQPGPGPRSTVDTTAAPAPAVPARPAHFLGLRTVIYHVTNLDSARVWYSAVLGIAPYFDQPFYIGFDVGGFELGLDPDMAQVEQGTGGVDAYWGVANVDSALARLLRLGAEPMAPVQDVGDGIRHAMVLDPWGNRLGIMENPNFHINNSSTTNDTTATSPGDSRE